MNINQMIKTRNKTKFTYPATIPGIAAKVVLALFIYRINLTRQFFQMGNFISERHVI